MRKHRTLCCLFSVFITPLTVLFLLSCEDVPEISTRCDLKASYFFVNKLTDSLHIIIVDSTKWNFLSNSLTTHTVSLPESTFTLAGKDVHLDSILVTWEIEHSDIYEEAEPCSAEVDLVFYAVVSDSADSTISTIDLNVNCSRKHIDTTFTDSSGIPVAKFSYTATIFIDSTDLIP